MNKKTFVTTSTDDSITIHDFQTGLDESQSDSVKNDYKDEKVMMNLLPFEELYEIARVYTAGAKKYGPNKWQNLPDGYERYKGAMLRHLLEVERGNEVDSDTGCYHAAQVAWNAIAMLHFKLKEYKSLHEDSQKEPTSDNEVVKDNKVYNGQLPFCEWIPFEEFQSSTLAVSCKVVVETRSCDTVEGQYDVTNDSLFLYEAIPKEQIKRIYLVYNKIK